MVRAVLCVPLFSLLVVVGQSQSQSNDAPAAYMNRASLLSGAEKARSRITDLHVRFRFDAEGGGSSYLGKYVSQEVAIRGGKIYTRMDFGASKETLRRHEATFDGGLSTYHLPHLGRAILSPQPRVEATTRNAAFFDITMLHDPGPHTGGPSSSLIGFLREPIVRVRPVQERILDHWCHVAELVEIGTDTPIQIVWIDQDRGFAPVRQQHFDGNGNLSIEFAYADISSFGNDTYLPIRATKVAITPNRTITTHMEIESDVDGLPFLRINTGVPDEMFDLAVRLPPGTRVYFEHKGIATTIPGDDYRAIAESMRWARSGLRAQTSAGTASSQNREPPDTASGSNDQGLQLAQKNESQIRVGGVRWVIPVVFAGIVAIAVYWWRRRSA